MKIEYEIIPKSKFDNSLRKVFANMLSKQGKVRGDLASKLDRCSLICLVKIDGIEIAIGGIKEKTRSDFESNKAGVPELSSEFEWELGYLYTDGDYSGRGIASNISRLLINAYGEGNLMATTEISANPKMVTILEKQGFRMIGNPWKSDIHNNYLGLFLKFM